MKTQKIITLLTISILTSKIIFNNMKFIFLCCLAFLIASSAISQNQNDEQRVKQATKAWYNSFNKHNYDDYPNYTTEDCVGINPYGAYHKRSNETPAIFNQAHTLFLRKLSIEVDSMAVRFIKLDVAIATIFSTQKGAMYLPPDGKQKLDLDNVKLIATMIVVKQNNKWLISQYQQTTVASLK